MSQHEDDLELPPRPATFEGRSERDGRFVSGAWAWASYANAVRRQRESVSRTIAAHDVMEARR